MYKLTKYLLIFISIYTFHTVIESYIINKQIKEFKDNATFQFTIENNSYYKVRSLIEYSSGDILLSRKSGNQNLLLRDIISFYVGGHAALSINEEQTVEVFGNLESDNYVKVYENDWLETELEVIGLRIDGNYEIDHSKYINQSYNWFPFYNSPSRRYCTDLVSKLFNQVGININYDYGVITVNDIILSKNTNIYLYKETIGDKVNIYYMG